MESYPIRTVTIGKYYERNKIEKFVLKFQFYDEVILTDHKFPTFHPCGNFITGWVVFPACINRSAHACALVIETHDLDHPEACGLVNVSSDSYPIRTVTFGKYYFIIKLKLENKFFNFLQVRGHLKLLF